MRIDRSSVAVLTFVFGAVLGVGIPPASAQGLGGTGGLGGYGAAPGLAMPGMVGGSPMVIPYGGTFEGFMPGRTGGGATLSFRTRPGATTAMPRGGFGLSPMSRGLSGMSGGIPGIGAMGSSGSGRAGGLGGMGPGSSRRMPGGAGTSVMPPRIGYPFRQPPSLVSPSSSGMGMSM